MGFLVVNSRSQHRLTPWQLYRQPTCVILFYPPYLSKLSISGIYSVGVTWMDSKGFLLLCVLLLLLFFFFFSRWEFEWRLYTINPAFIPSCHFYLDFFFFTSSLRLFYCAFHMLWISSAFYSYYYYFFMDFNSPGSGDQRNCTQTESIRFRIDIISSYFVPAVDHTHQLSSFKNRSSKERN